MELSTKLYILDDDGRKFMGAGVLWLLERIEELLMNGEDFSEE